MEKMKKEMVEETPNKNWTWRNNMEMEYDKQMTDYKDYVKVSHCKDFDHVLL